MGEFLALLETYRTGDSLKKPTGNYWFVPSRSLSFARSAVFAGGENVRRVQAFCAAAQKDCYGPGGIRTHENQLTPEPT